MNSGKRGRTTVLKPVDLLSGLPKTADAESQGAINVVLLEQFQETANRCLCMEKRCQPVRCTVSVVE
jgi:hypothetical protein